MVRGILPETLLCGFGKYLWPGILVPDSAKSFEVASEHYALSFPVMDYARFLSHSWRASAVAKVLTLYAFYNGMAAVLAGLLGASTI